MRDLVFVKEMCVVWATLGNHAVIKICPSLFTAKPIAFRLLGLAVLI